MVESMVFDSNELLRKSLANDATAFGELLEHYRPYLLVLALRYLDTRLQSRSWRNPVCARRIAAVHARRDNG